VESVIHESITVLQPPIDGLGAMEIADVEEEMEGQDSFSSEGSERERDLPDDEVADSEDEELMIED
jgi:hypothetical protein